MPTANRTSGQPRPNIVFVMLDDAGFNDVGWHAGYKAPAYTEAKDSNLDSYGGNYFKTDFTPRMSELASQGIKLEQLYAQSVCSPTRASLLTGLYEPLHGVGPSVVKVCDAHGVPLKFEFFTEKLHELGYRSECENAQRAALGACFANEKMSV